MEQRPHPREIVLGQNGVARRGGRRAVERFRKGRAVGQQQRLGGDGRFGGRHPGPYGLCRREDDRELLLFGRGQPSLKVLQPRDQPGDRHDEPVAKPGEQPARGQPHLLGLLREFEARDELAPSLGEIGRGLQRLHVAGLKVARFQQEIVMPSQPFAALPRKAASLFDRCGEALGKIVPRPADFAQAPGHRVGLFHGVHRAGE